MPARHEHHKAKFKVSAGFSAFTYFYI